MAFFKGALRIMNKGSDNNAIATEVAGAISSMVGNTVKDAQDATIASVATKTTMWGYAGSVAGFLADNGVAIAVGTIVTIGGFIVNLIFQRRRNQREKDAIDAERIREEERLEMERQRHEWLRKEHEVKLRRLEAGLDLDEAKNH